MIKRELFQRYSKKIFIFSTALSMSVALNGFAVNADVIDNNLANTVQATEVETVASRDMEATVLNIINKRIEIVGGSPFDLRAGVSAVNGKLGDMTSAVKVSGVDISLLGVDQVIKYSIVDAAGNEATAEAILHIKDNPVQTLDKTMYSITRTSVYAQPDKYSDIVVRLDSDQSVHVTGKTSSVSRKSYRCTGENRIIEWNRVQLEDGTMGYVFAVHMTDTVPKPLDESKRVPGFSNVYYGELPSPPPRPESCSCGCMSPI